MCAVPIADEHQPQLMHGNCGTCAQKLEQGLPSTTNHLFRRHDKPFALPRIVTNAHGGLVVEINCLKLGLVEERGYEVARAGHVIAVPCKRVRKEER